MDHSEFNDDHLHSDLTRSSRIPKPGVKFGHRSVCGRETDKKNPQTRFQTTVDKVVSVNNNDAMVFFEGECLEW